MQCNSERRPYRVLLVHNGYQHRGGEDSVFEAEFDLLRQRGHEVELYTRHNDDISTMSRAQLLHQTFWSNRTMKDIADIVRRFRPDVIHVHNTMPLISPSLYWAASRARVPIVQTLHNFRLLCPQAMFLREGIVCEDCLGHAPWRGVLHRCYRASAVQTAVLAGTLTLHRAIGTWRHKVARYIALNAFCRDKFIAGGLPAERICIKPNFADLPVAPTGERKGGLFVGRLSPEKGLHVLLAALDRNPSMSIPIIGSGPSQTLVRAHAQVRWLGSKSQSEVFSAMASAAWLVLPSICYESFPRTIVEAFACGLPVIASRLGTMEQLVDDGRTGLLFEPGNPVDLTEKIAWAEAHPDEMRKMGNLARTEFEAKYSADRNYETLMMIYSDAIGGNVASQSSMTN